MDGEIKVITIDTRGEDLRDIRDAVSNNLNDRDDRFAPLMSEWLVRRAFGPRPKREHAASYDPTK
ncbi:hypothetical protein ACC720_32440 [Rhizobium ruizarguesonis]